MIRLDGFRTMDPQMLYSIVNMKLRDHYQDLDELARAEGIDRLVLEQRLAEAGYTYQPDLNQFRQGKQAVQRDRGC